MLWVNHFDIHFTFIGGYVLYNVWKISSFCLCRCRDFRSLFFGISCLRRLGWCGLLSGISYLRRLSWCGLFSGINYLRRLGWCCLLSCINYLRRLGWCGLFSSINYLRWLSWCGLFSCISCLRRLSWCGLLSCTSCLRRLSWCGLFSSISYLCRLSWCGFGITCGCLSYRRKCLWLWSLGGGCSLGRGCWFFSCILSFWLDCRLTISLSGSCLCHDGSFLRHLFNSWRWRFRNSSLCRRVCRGALFDLDRNLLRYLLLLLFLFFRDIDFTNFRALVLIRRHRRWLLRRRHCFIAGFGRYFHLWTLHCHQSACLRACTLYILLLTLLLLRLCWSSNTPWSRNLFCLRDLHAALLVRHILERAFKLHVFVIAQHLGAILLLLHWCVVQCTASWVFLLLWTYAVSWHRALVCIFLVVWLGRNTHPSMIQHLCHLLLCLFKFQKFLLVGGVDRLLLVNATDVISVDWLAILWLLLHSAFRGFTFGAAYILSVFQFPFLVLNFYCLKIFRALLALVSGCLSQVTTWVREVLLGAPLTLIAFTSHALYTLSFLLLGFVSLNLKFIAPEFFEFDISAILGFFHSFSFLLIFGFLGQFYVSLKCVDAMAQLGHVLLTLFHVLFLFEHHRAFVSWIVQVAPVHGRISIEAIIMRGATFVEGPSTIIVVYRVHRQIARRFWHRVFFVASIFWNNVEVGLRWRTVHFFNIYRGSRCLIFLFVGLSTERSNRGCLLLLRSLFATDAWISGLWWRLSVLNLLICYSDWFTDAAFGFLRPWWQNHWITTAPRAAALIFMVFGLLALKHLLDFLSGSSRLLARRCLQSLFQTHWQLVTESVTSAWHTTDTALTKRLIFTVLARDSIVVTFGFLLFRLLGNSWIRGLKRSAWCCNFTSHLTLLSGLNSRSSRSKLLFGCRCTAFVRSSGDRLSILSLWSLASSSLLARCLNFRRRLWRW